MIKQILLSAFILFNTCLFSQEWEYVITDIYDDGSVVKKHIVK